YHEIGGGLVGAVCSPEIPVGVDRDFVRKGQWITGAGVADDGARGGGAIGKQVTGGEFYQGVIYEDGGPQISEKIASERGGVPARAAAEGDVGKWVWIAGLELGGAEF